MKLTLQTYLWGGNNIISWQWDFGDGGNSTVKIQVMCIKTVGYLRLH